MANVPHLVQMQEKWGPKGLTIMAITDSDRAAAEAFAAANNVTYPIRVSGVELREAYGVSMVWGTVTYLVNPAGKVVASDIDEFDGLLTAALIPAIS